jgi:hypothetical protein
MQLEYIIIYKIRCSEYNENNYSCKMYFQILRKKFHDLKKMK